jgi:hypothetical protein
MAPVFSGAIFIGLSLLAEHLLPTGMNLVAKKVN